MLLHFPGERDVNSNSCVTQGTAANVMFTHVEETLKGLWDQLSSGSVTVGIIRKLQPKQSQMKKLIDSCSKELGLHFEAFEQRLQELEAYQTHLKGVHLFCSSFSIPVEGIPIVQYLIYLYSTFFNGNLY